MRVTGRAVRALGFALGFTVAGQALPAQAAPPAGARELETRAGLEAQAAAAEQAGRTAEAFLLRNRLQRGDFQEGDRIVVSLLGTTPFNDTISVRANKLLPLPQMGELSLEGVLRSELTPRLSSHLAKFLRDSSVRATPLLRVAVLGQVASPGFYYVSADVLLSDVLMKAGGPAATADLRKTEIRRAGETIWDRASTTAAIADGLSLDRLHLKAGDEVYVGERRERNWSQYLQVGISTIGVVLGLVLAFR